MATQSSIPAQSLLHTSPFKHTGQGSEKFSAIQQAASAWQRRFSKEMLGSWVGGMDANQFLVAFMPVAVSIPEKKLDNVDFTSIPFDTGLESDMYPKLVSVIREGLVFN